MEVRVNKKKILGSSILNAWFYKRIFVVACWGKFIFYDMMSIICHRIVCQRFIISILRTSECNLVLAKQLKRVLGMHLFCPAYSVCYVYCICYGLSSFYNWHISIEKQKCHLYYIYFRLTQQIHFIIVPGFDINQLCKEELGVVFFCFDFYLYVSKNNFFFGLPSFAVLICFITSCFLSFREMFLQFLFFIFIQIQ